MDNQIFTLTTDFGLKDVYASEIKATILSFYSTAQIVDITHQVKKFDVRSGAYMLASAAPYFPKGTIHIAVVDPDVGSQRRPLIIHTKWGFFVGPDNGLMILAAENQGIKEVREITSRHLMLPYVSETFHGRDIFAPAAAHLANGVDLEEFGPKVTDLIRPTFTKLIKEKGRIEGEILHVDDFGNIITNIKYDALNCLGKDLLQIELAQNKLQLKLSKTYTTGKAQQLLLLIGSHGYMEIAINQGNAANKLQVKPGDKIYLFTS
jgi:S-adenosylmethionine hydrolase